MPDPEAITLTAGILFFLVGVPAAISYGVYRLVRDRLRIGRWMFAGLAVVFWAAVLFALRAAGV